MRLQTPRGTKDYLPADMVKRRFVIEKLRKVFESYGYGEVMTPAFEYLELLEAKAGEEVKEQIYWFKDKGGRLLGLRFEMTTPIARIVAQNPVMPKPIRFYYIQPVWRYEEPQRGRLREFSHAGIELIGYSGPSADAEVIAVTVNALKKAGLKDLEVRVNDRRIVEKLLETYGLGHRIEDALRILDKLERKGEAYVKEQLKKISENEKNIQELIKIIKMEGSNDDKLKTVEEILSENGEVTYLYEVLDELKNGYNIVREIKVDYTIVRGLAYYTGIVFEVKALRALEVGSVAGGGRYDELIKTIGGPQIPATGMSIGLERLIDALELEGSLKVTYLPARVMVLPVNEKYWIHGLNLAEKLRERDIPALISTKKRGLSHGLEQANKSNIPYVVILGEKEVKSGLYTLRDLRKWREEIVDFDELVRKLSS